MKKEATACTYIGKDNVIKTGKPTEKAFYHRADKPSKLSKQAQKIWHMFFIITRNRLTAKRKVKFSLVHHKHGFSHAKIRVLLVIPGKIYYNIEKMYFP